MASLATSASPILRLDAGVILPGMTITLALETEEARAAARAAEGAENRLVILPRVGGRVEGPEEIGVAIAIERSGFLPGGTPAIVIKGLERVVVGDPTATAGASAWAEPEPVNEPAATEKAYEDMRELRVVVDTIGERRGPRHLSEVMRGLDHPGEVADTAGYWPELEVSKKAELLRTVDPNRRIELVLGWAREALAQLELKDRIRSDVADGMERTQRDYLLRQQLAAIRKELGDGEEGADAADDYRAKLQAIEVSDMTKSTISKEIDKLERTSEQSPEQGWIRAWLDTVFEMPWGIKATDILDLVSAREVLDADHTGLDDVKDRIVAHLAVRKLRTERGMDSRPSGRSPEQRRGAGMILALVGPPGVGKTSLGASIARATGRAFVRVALGGVRDEAEIRGHRRTYVGAMPGRIVRAIKDAGSLNPVVLLDEVDKLGSDWRGDPSSALLEVLDPAQNHTFRDHYLDLDLDLSDVMFVATANVFEQVPAALVDRMEVVRLEGYTDDEKVTIGRDHLIPRQLERAGLLDGEVSISNDALHSIIEGYTREAGVRDLERQIGKVLRKVSATVVSEIALGHAITGKGAEVDSDGLHEWLGRRIFYPEVAARTSLPGVATGLAVTGTGGDVLFVEASTSEGEPGLTVTGQLGDVMRESAQIAVSYVRAHQEAVGAAADAFENRRVHIHVPAGAIPKDGPSAGVTMATALASLLSGRSVRSEIGMTGELTLQGKVLPIGGVKQKVLAAHRAGLREVILPERNGQDLEDVPKAVREDMTFHLVADVSQVLDHALAS